MQDHDHSMVRVDYPETTTVFNESVYYDEDYDTATPPPPSAFCSSLLANLGFRKFWWLIIIIQLACLLPPLVMQRLCILLPILSFVHLTNIITLYLNTSLWIWVVYLIVALSHCGIGLDNPLFVTGCVFVSVFGLLSVLDCFLGREGWYLVDLKQMQDAVKYFEKMKASPPAHRVHIECFHTSTTSALNTRGRILTRTNKVISFTDHRDFPMTSWSDMSDWPVLETMAAQGAAIIGVSLAREVEAGDQLTKDAFDSFRNKFVQQNCHRDEQIRTWVSCEIPDMGPEQSIFITTRTKDEKPVCFRIGFFLCLAVLCISCPLRTFIRKKTRLVPLKVRKVYFYDPGKMSLLSPLSCHPPSVNMNMNVDPGSTISTNHHLGANLNMGMDMKSDYKMTSLENSLLERGLPPANLNKPNNLASGVRNQGALPRDHHASDLLYNNKADMDMKYPEKSWVGGGGTWNGGTWSSRDQRPQYSDHKQDHWQSQQLPPERAPAWPPDPTSNLYLPGKDYYDPPHYTQSEHGDCDPYQGGLLERGGQAGGRHMNNFRAQEEEERLYNNATHPRVAMLKNTNVESEMLARRREYGAAGRRVHYSDREEDYGTSYNRRHQSPSPGPRQRPENPGGHHRSRRLQYSDSREDYNHMDTRRLLEEETYNA